MDIKLISGQYKSLKKIEWHNVPDFAVITGINGSGKTQLLELINYYYNKEEYQQYLTRTKIPFPNFQIEGVSYQKDDFLFLRTGQLNLVDLGIINISAYQSLVHNIYDWACKKGSNQPEYEKITNKFEHVTGKKIKDISEDDFLENLPTDFNIIKGTKFNEKVHQLFYSYHIKYLNEKLKGHSDKEIRVTLKTPPWEILNKDLEKIGFQYQFTYPTGKNLLSQFELKLKHTKYDVILNFSDLSGGERVLMSLVFWAYNSTVHNAFPKFILLDEPDAHLHPSMTRTFIDVVYEILVKKYGARVIMTTHSPSTVTLVEDKFVFEMQIEEPRIFRTTNKSKTISLLTSNLITVTPRTKYSIVEDTDDVEFYSRVLQTLKTEKQISNETSIVFISASSQKGKDKISGGKTVANAWVEKLRLSGLDDIIMGIVDGEAKVEAKNGVLAIERHSIENYLLDPIIIYGTLLERGKIPEVKDVSLAFGDEYKIRELPINILQTIADSVIELIEKDNGSFSNESKKRVTVSLANGQKINYPTWLIETHGHQLMNIVRSKLGNDVVTNKNLLNSLRKIRILPMDLKILYDSIWTEHSENLTAVPENVANGQENNIA